MEYYELLSPSFWKVSIWLFISSLDLANLESIEVGYDCFSNVNLIELTNLPKLKTISSHGDSSPSMISSSSPSYGGTFLLDSLPVLETIHMEGNAFDLFDTLILQNLPQFKQLYINATGDNALGKLQLTSYLFFLFLILRSSSS